MTHIEHFKELVKNRSLPKLFAVGGSEAALIDEAMTLLRQWHQENDPFGLNYHRFLASEDAWHEVLNALQTPPFGSPCRLVELHAVEKLDASAITPILDYMADPAPFAQFVLIFNKIDKRNKLIQALEKQQWFFNAELNAKDIIALLRLEAQRCGLMIDAEVEQYLLLALDNNLISIKQALQKLSLNFENKPLSIEDVAVHVVGSASNDVFKLAKAISEANVKDALGMLAIIRNQENALKFLGVLIWQFRVLVHIRHCLDKGMVDWDIRQEVSIYGDRFLWMLKVAKKRPIAFHIGRLTKLLHCDLTLKSQKTAEPFNVIERLVYQSAIGF